MSLARIVNLEGSNLLPKGHLTPKAHILTYKISLINFKFSLQYNKRIQELFLIHSGFHIRTLLKYINKRLLLDPVDKSKLLTKYHPLIQAHVLSGL